MKIERQEIKVTLMIRVKIDGIWRRFAVLYGKSGRVIPGLVILKGSEKQYEDVAYELRHYKGGQACYTPAGKNASEAEAKRRALAIQLSVKAVAKDSGVAIVENFERKAIRAWAANYPRAKFVPVGDSQKRKMMYAIQIFLKSNSKIFIDELTHSDMLIFLETLQGHPVYWLARKSPSKRVNADQGRRRLPVEHRCISRRTVFAYFMAVRSWLLEGGADKKIFPPPPKYEQKEITMYTPDEVAAFYSLATGNLRMAVNLMLKCGMRRQEAAHACFRDIDYANKTIIIREKPEYGFQTKTRKQRRVPIPDDLIVELRDWEELHPGHLLIIQTPKGKPDRRMLPLLKRFVYLHGLRCGRCNHCRLGNPNCAGWEFHKFRRTYITAICRHVDLRTAQTYAGHERITSTERYLKAASASEGQSRVSAIDFTKSFYDPSAIN
jgi:integrase